MNYQEKMYDLLQWMYETVRDFAGSSTYDIPYEWVKDGYQIDLANRDVQSEIRDIWCDSKYMDLIQAMDFDDLHRKVYVMIWESNNKKKYTLENYKEFCDKALICPSFEDDESWQKWIDEHKIQIIANDCVMELDYDADAVNEIEFSLREIHEAILGDGEPTIGNTIGSEYRNATWKDILRFAVLDGWYEDSHTLEAEIDKCIHRFNRARFEEIMKKIDNQTSMNDELEVNFFKLDTQDLWKIFDEKERRQAFKEILCSKVEISEMINENGETNDIAVIMDYSILPHGDLVGWHYGVDFDKNSADNQEYIQDYIKEMTK